MFELYCCIIISPSFLISMYKKRQVFQGGTWIVYCMTENSATRAEKSRGSELAPATAARFFSSKHTFPPAVAVAAVGDEWAIAVHDIFLTPLSSCRHV